jgi:hypothetical protein
LFKQKDAEETEKLGYRLKKGQIKYIWYKEDLLN